MLTNVYQVIGVRYSLMREDLIYLDPQLYLMTVHERPDFKNYS